MEHGEYVARLQRALAAGWNGFTADLVEVEPAKPKDVPGKYVMRPYDAKLKYMGRQR